MQKMKIYTCNFIYSGLGRLFYKKYVLFLCLFFASSALADEEPIFSNIFVLIDYSATYYKDYRRPLMKKNLENLTEALTSKKGAPRATTLLQVLPIDDLSQKARPLCEFKLLRKKRISFRMRDRCGPMLERQCSIDRNRFKIYMNVVCKKTLFIKEAANKTDISGALSLVSQLAKVQTDKGRFLIIFSDMDEDRNPEVTVSAIDLTDFNILVVCNSEPLERSKEATKKIWCVDSEKNWVSRFKKLGAKNVFYTVETAKWYTKLARDFFNGR